MWPYTEKFATVLHNFSPKAPSQLKLIKDSEILILGKEGEEKGWWRGRNNENKVAIDINDYLFKKNEKSLFFRLDTSPWPMFVSFQKQKNRLKAISMCKFISQ